LSKAGLSKTIQSRALQVAAIAALVFSMASLAAADTVYGTPVANTSSSATVGLYNSGTHATTFYIPLSQSHSGVYGVGGVGTSADSGSGYGYNDPTKTALTMYLMFAPVILPVQTASLSFTFTDLDLVGVNDPAYFFEDVQFFSKTGTALTPLITTNGQSGTTPLAFSVSGNSTTQTVFFPDVTSIIDNPFYVKLTFDSKWNQPGTNTPESLVATLTTTRQTSVPEPASLVLLGGGIAAAMGTKRRKLFS
jgi:hypothetical protein